MNGSFHKSLLVPLILSIACGPSGSDDSDSDSTDTDHVIENQYEVDCDLQYAWVNGIVPFEDLADAIDATKSGDTITLCPGDYEGGHTLTTDLRLESSEGSDETKVLGNRSQPVFLVRNAQVNFLGLTITEGGGATCEFDGEETCGGGVLVEDANVEFLDVQISESGADFGGAVWANEASHLSFDQSSIYNTHSDDSYTGAIHGPVDLISNSSIRDNDNDGVNATATTLIVRDSTFSDNNGPGLDLIGNLDISGSTFINNNSALTVEGNVIGNGVDITDNGNGANIKGDAELNGWTVSGNGGDGLTLRGANELVDVNVNGNTTTGVFVTGDLICGENTLIYGNRYGLKTSDGTVSDCQVYSNSDAGVYVYGDTTLNNLDIYDNAGPGIESNDSIPDLMIFANDVNVYGNVNDRGNFGDGGGLSLGANVERLEWDGGSIKDNFASSTGGGVFLFQTVVSDWFTFTDVDISGNSAEDEGGGMFLTGGDVTLDGCTLTSNSSDVLGGGVSLFNSVELDIINTDFGDSSAEENTPDDIATDTMIEDWAIDLTGVVSLSCDVSGCD